MGLHDDAIPCIATSRRIDLLDELRATLAGRASAVLVAPSSLGKITPRSGAGSGQTGRLADLSAVLGDNRWHPLKRIPHAYQPTVSTLADLTHKPRFFALGILAP